MPGLNSGRIDFGDNGYGSGDFCGFGLRTTHTPQTGRDKQAPFEVGFFTQPKFYPAGVQKCIIGSMDNTLGADIHPSPRCHLTVACHAHLGGDFPIVKIVIKTHHQAVGNDDPRVCWSGFKKTQGMTGCHHQGLVFGQHLQIFFYQTILHPVLADRSGFTIGHQFIRVEGHIEI